MIRSRGKNRLIWLLFCLSLFFASSLIFLWAQNHPGSARYNDLIKNYSRQIGVPAELVHSVIKVESNYNEKAVSPKGAMGLMQLMPETAKFYGVADPFNPEENIRGGILFLKDLIRLYGGRTNYVLAAYNAGQEALKKFGGIPPYPETLDYIRKVMSHYSRPYIPSGLPIYRIQDDTGKIVLTNDPLYLLTVQGKREGR